MYSTITFWNHPYHNNRVHKSSSSDFLLSISAYICPTLNCTFLSWSKRMNADVRSVLWTDSLFVVSFRIVAQFHNNISSYCRLFVTA
jgi:hypothetical protein